MSCGRCDLEAKDHGPDGTCPDLLTLDCGDHSCDFAKDKSGMRTNGGCRCLKPLPDYQRHKVKVAFKALEKEKDAALLQNSELQKEIERCKEIAERDGKDYSAKVLEVKLLHTAIDKSNEALEAAVKTREERDNLLRLNSEMRALLIRWNDAWKVAAIVDSGHTHTDVALINAQTELFLEATPEEKRNCECGADLNKPGGHPCGYWNEQRR